MLSNFRSIVQQSMRSISLLGRVNKKFTINDNNEFVDKVLNSRIPVIVTFHAEWCEPCKILTPKLEELVEPLEDLHLAIVDVESNPELVHTFEVKAVPAVIAVSNGLVVDKFIGLVEANMIENLIQKLLKKDSKNQKT
ncbi:thioredoxin, mitochondrial [Leptopilina heterotoma]|uniref:thioredoxin, mitochondrial n=1 Tax=Leptopilina heterotoma TaxID=63436 RepID=UPI001CA7F124|nr:thioredoxin, mitochondrial [Leptopilina heterotoma]